MTAKRYLPAILISPSMSDTRNTLNIVLLYHMHLRGIAKRNIYLLEYSTKYVIAL